MTAPLFCCHYWKLLLGSGHIQVVYSARYTLVDRGSAMDSVRLLRAREVCQIVGFSPSQLYKRIAAGTFPRPVRLGPNMARWPNNVIEEWIQEAIEAGQA